MLEVDSSRYSNYEDVDEFLAEVASEEKYQVKGYKHLMYASKLRVGDEVKTYGLSEYICLANVKLGALRVSPLVKELIDDDTKKPYFEVLLDIRREGRCYSRAIVIDKLKKMPTWADIKKFVDDDIRQQKLILDEINRRDRARKH